MLTAKDIRVGNFICNGLKYDEYGVGEVLEVGNEDREFEQIYCMCSESFEWFFKDNYCGIPLNDEWFKKLNFKKTISFYIEIDEEKLLEFAYNNDNSTNQYYAYFRNKNKNGEDDFVLLRKNIKFVHEVQNLYHSIKGKDLEVELW